MKQKIQYPNGAWVLALTNDFFFDFKEAPFMEVLEQVEVRFRREVLSVVERPGPSPRLRHPSIA